jgi:hypothetical protein
MSQIEQSLHEGGNALGETAGTVLEENITTINPETLHKVKKALKFIDPNIPRDLWGRIGMALKSEFGDDGIDIFNEWSEGCDSYNWDDLKSTWDSINGSGGVNIGTLFYMAKQNPDYKDSCKPLTAKEKQELNEERQAREKQRHEEQEAEQKRKNDQYERAAINALAMWEHAGDIDPAHKYLVDKSITGFGVRMYDRDLYLQMYHEGKLASIQQIFESGKKKFMPGGKTKDCYMVIGDIKDNVLLCEGWATGCSLHKRTKEPVVVAFTCNNLLGVGQWFSQKYPEAKIIIVADNDVKTEKKTGRNPGIDKARAAAEELKCKYIFPDFRTCDFTGTDFNDFLEQGGKITEVIHVDDFMHGASAAEDPLGWVKDCVLSEEEMDMIANPEFIIDNFIISGHIVAIVAKPNGGKTLLFMHLAGVMATADYRVIYVNADTGAGDAKPMKVQADANGFTLATPDLAGDSVGMGGVVDQLRTMAAKKDEDYSKIVFIFDTLKKMTNLMNKTESKELYILFRKLTAKGMTIVVLGHTNKHDDKNGRPVYEGVGDLRADVDELIYLLPEKHDDGSMLITTDPDKTRGDIKPLTFKVDANRNVSLCPAVVDVAARQNIIAQLERDEQVIEAIDMAIKDNHASQINIIEAANDSHRVSRNKVLAALNRYTCNKSGATYDEAEGRLWQSTHNGRFKEYHILPAA